ncbi:hypothetical protein [Peribacillus simplex]|uniref:hypothetical protein n=1 Tax=Peribacillus simplex TaxID=1478 RepID=UPI0015C3906B|nr:hypothetical protein [Peribacillus simplex]
MNGNELYRSYKEIKAALETQQPPLLTSHYEIYPFTPYIIDSIGHSIIRFTI